MEDNPPTHNTERDNFSQTALNYNQKSGNLNILLRIVCVLNSSKSGKKFL